MQNLKRCVFQECGFMWEAVVVMYEQQMVLQPNHLSSVDLSTFQLRTNSERTAEERERERERS